MLVENWKSGAPAATVKGPVPQKVIFFPEIFEKYSIDVIRIL